MKELKTKITIQATPDKIWRILQDLKFYATWNPFIIYAAGQVSKGKKFSFILKAPGEKPKFFRSIFKEIKENKELRWLKGLFYLDFTMWNTSLNSLLRKAVKPCLNTISSLAAWYQVFILTVSNTVIWPA